MWPMNNLQRMISQSRFGSQAAIAEYIGVDQATVQRACTEHKSAKLRTYRLCADALGVTLADIFAEPDRDRAERALLQAYRALPDDRQRGWDDLVASVLAQRPQSSPADGQTQNPKEMTPLLQNHSS
jgi:transcriptional regulator with XRE-family HTH domain